MTVVPFPRAERRPVDDPAEIAAVEALIAAVGAVVAVSGGAVAIARLDLHASAPAERAAVLAPMLDAGEIVFGWRAADGVATNVVLERLVVNEAAGWRAEVYVERAEGHFLDGVLADPDPAGIGRALCAVAQGDRSALTGPAEALARIARR